VREIFGATPTHQQEKLLRAIAKDNAHVAVKSGHGVGKGVPLELVTVTPDGPRFWGDLKVGDDVFSLDGSPTRIKAVYPLGRVKVYNVIFTDGSSLETTGDHLWKVKTRKERRYSRGWRIATTEELIPLCKRSNGRSMARQIEIPPYEPVAFRKKKELPLHPYFVGCWIGDGSRNRGTISKPEIEIYEHLIEIGVDASFVDNNRINCRGCITHLRELGLLDCTSPYRYIPDIYKYSSIEDRFELLRGLIDTDGYIAPSGICVYTTTSSQLRDDIVWLVRSLGGIAIAQKATKKAHYIDEDGYKVQCNDAYNVTIRFKPGTKLGYVSRKQKNLHNNVQDRYLKRWIDRIEEVGMKESMCIEVEAPDHMYLAGEDFVPTHNTSTLAWSLLWYLWTRLDVEIPCTAPSAHQLNDVLWSEIDSWRMKMPKDMADATIVTKDRVTIEGCGKKQYAVARTARRDQPSALQGFHAKNLMFLIDEAAEVPNEIFEVMRGTLTTSNARVVMTGNPTMVTGYFYEAFNSNRHLWDTYTFSCLDSPLVTKEYIELMKQEYGEDSDQYRVRVLGEFPSASVQQFIPLELVEAAVNRHIHEIEYNFAPVILGADVSYFGDDSSCLFLRQGLYSEKLWEGMDIDTLEYADKIYRFAVERNADKIFVDVTGVGAGVVDQLRRMGLSDKTVGVNGAAASSRPELANKRMEMWYEMKEWLKSGGAIPDDRKLRDDLVTPYYDYHRGTGKMKLESKQAIKKVRKMPSPDRADALALTFAYPIRKRVGAAAEVMFVSGGRARSIGGGPHAVLVNS
jgi:uncharacterized protein (UPF0248 family)